MTDILEDWTNPKWEELDWARVKDMSTRYLLEYRHSQAQQAQMAFSFDCAKFLKHVRFFLKLDYLS